MGNNTKLDKSMELKWENSSILEKVEYVKLGKLAESVIIFPEQGLFPEWKNIKKVDQLVLRKVMSEVKK